MRTNSSLAISFAFWSKNLKKELEQSTEEPTGRKHTHCNSCLWLNASTVVPPLNFASKTSLKLCLKRCPDSRCTHTKFPLFSKPHQITACHRQPSNRTLVGMQAWRKMRKSCVIRCLQCNVTCRYALTCRTWDSVDLFLFHVWLSLAHAASFGRRGAGSSGCSSRGILRLHQRISVAGR